MKRVIYLLVFTFLTTSCIFSQIPDIHLFGWFGIKGNDVYQYYPCDLVFNNQSYSLEIDFTDVMIPEVVNRSSVVTDSSGSIYSEIGNYKLTFDNTIPFIRCEKGSLLDGNLILFSNEKVLIGNSETVIFESIINGNASERIMFAEDIIASSSLAEGDTIYQARFIDLLLGKKPYMPWVEGKPDYGIGETIVIRYKGFIPIKGFTISNGFVSFLRPDLFTKNSRIKRIRVVSNNSYSKDFTLLDSANFQYLDLGRSYTPPEGSFTETFTFTILEIYKGEKWTDTCLNKVIPICYW